MMFSMKKSGLLFLALANLVACVTVEQTTPTPAASASDAGASQDGGVEPFAPVEDDAAQPPLPPDAAAPDSGKVPWASCAGAGTPSGNGVACGNRASDGGVFDDAKLCPSSCGGGYVYTCESGGQPPGLTCYTPPGGGSFVCCAEAPN
jgi:hypothetical protein